MPSFADANSVTGRGMGYDITPLQIAQMQTKEQAREFDIGQQAQYQSAEQAAGGITDLVNEYNQAYSQAVSQYTENYNKMLGLVGDVGGQQAADIRSQYGSQASAGMQNLARLGMGNTTIGANQNLGIQRSQSAALNTLANQINAQELGIMQGYKTNAELAPDKSALVAAIQQGQSASGNYGGSLTQALAALSFGANGGSGTGDTSNISGYTPTAATPQMFGGFG